MAKRIFDLMLSILGLILMSPIFILISIWIKLDSKGPVFFRQERVGQYGGSFNIHKFRTMITDAEEYGPQLTIGNDSRITKSGAFLRQFKLDELPQLFDVARGKMSMVGPRPEVPKYVAYYPEDFRELIFSLKPGITDLASIEYRDESALLGKAVDPEQAYINEVLPIKVKYYKEYAISNNLFKDFSLIMKTLRIILSFK